MSREGLALPPPVFGLKHRPAAPQALQIQIQVPCQISKYVNEKWDMLSTNALVQLVNQSNIELLRVLDIQNQPMVDQPLTELKWTALTPLTFELDILREGILENVYAVTFADDQHSQQFNKAFEESNNRNLLSSDQLYPFLVPLTDAIQRGDANEAMNRFRYLCHFPAEQRRFRIVAEPPLTPEEIKLRNTVNINITVENCEGNEAEITLRVPKGSSIGDLKEIMFMTYEIPPEVQKWLGEQSLFKTSDSVLENNGEPKKIYLYILNAAKVGLNRVDFMRRLETSRNNLKQKKAPVVAPQELHHPTHEDDVPLPAIVDHVYSHRGPHMEHSNPHMGQNPPTSSYMPSYPQDSVPSDTLSQEEESPKFLPGVLWTCNCKYTNAWESIRCEKCRNTRDTVVKP
ncbi:Sharpin [Oopsacas minuta]|uniref:Sharpin n=1 Tax=Oopsacas minuta TaxID=111878 RepID=A0AAV7JGN3_9METZ|nr:Sharpin [Oopsacas minuta]